MSKEGKVIKQARTIFEECIQDMWPPEKIQQIEISRIKQQYGKDSEDWEDKGEVILKNGKRKTIEMELDMSEAMGYSGENRILSYEVTDVINREPQQSDNH